MKILKMKLENFQGVKELEIDPQGESSAIYGDNGTGKSTVYNAFTWLMYGKPSTTEKNYTPKTTGSHNLHHSVEIFQFTPLHERQQQKCTIFSIKSTQFSTKPCFFIVTSRKVVFFSIPVQYFL